MARWGNADFEQLRELQERLQKLQSIDLNKFCEDASKELAARLLALVSPVHLWAIIRKKQAKRAAHYGEAGLRARKPHLVRMQKACRLKNRATTTLYGLLTPLSMQVMWSLGIGKHRGGLFLPSANGLKAVG
nr:hypothetical protein [Phascolarctobacterium sp.]